MEATTFCKLFIKILGLEYYVTRVKEQKPATNGPTARQWDLEHSLVISWLINAMQPNTAHGYLLLDTAWKIWSAVANTYSQIGNDARIYELRKKIPETKQGS